MVAKITAKLNAAGVQVMRAVVPPPELSSVEITAPVEAFSNRSVGSTAVEAIVIV